MTDYADFIAQHETDVANGLDADERTEHLPTCTAPLGGDCDCGPIPNDVWCSRCEAVAHFVVAGQDVCRTHALDRLWKMRSTSWNPQGSGVGPVVVTRYREVDNGQTIVTVATQHRVR